MRLLHIIHTLNPAAGGTAAAVRNFVLHPGESGQSVLSLDHSSDPWTKSYASEVHCLGPGKGKYGYTPRLRSWLHQNISLYDTAVVHGCWQYHGLAVRMEARAAGIPYFIFPHGMLDPYFNRSRAKHFKKLLYWPWERLILAQARAVLFTCQEEQARAHRAFSFRARGEIVPLGVSAPATNIPAAQAEFSARFPALQGKRLLIFLGRLHPKKGVDLLIQAFRQIADPSLHLLIVGPPEDKACAAKLGALAHGFTGQITFTGILTGHLKLGALASAEMLILPSHQENFGLSVVEALSLGRPVLISDQVNIWREIVGDGAGFVGPDTLPGVLDLLRKWNALGSSDLEKMRAAARNCFASRFRAESASDIFLKTLRQCGVTDDKLPRSLEPAFH